jgi:hypothetical protein
LTKETFRYILIQYRGVAQVGRALCSGRRGRRFESCRLDSVLMKLRGCTGFDRGFEAGEAIRR